MDSWLAQARRGVVELCVLQLIGQRPRYGYQLVTKLAAWEPLATTEGTLYPLLRRLQREGSITAYWEESQDGPPRKYYQLTDAGVRLLESQLAEWQRLTQAVTTLRTETNEDKEVPDGSGSRCEPTLSRRAARKPEPAARS